MRGIPLGLHALLVLWKEKAEKTFSKEILIKGLNQLGGGEGRIAPDVHKVELK